MVEGLSAFRLDRPAHFGVKRKAYKDYPRGLGMTHLDTIKLRPRGRLIIPASLREGFNDGEELVVINEGSQLILKKASSLSDEDKEDLEFARSTEAGWREIERGEYVEMDWDEFLEEAMRW